jgi:carbon monoxide dehydrogenase subunit G
MAPIVNSVEISRRPEDVFVYVTDPAHLHEWQESVVSARAEGPVGVGCKVVVTRNVGRIERSMTAEIAQLNPPREWRIHGLDGPIRGEVDGSIEPLGEGDRSLVRIALDLKAYGIGKVLLPLLVRRQAESEMPRNMQNLKRLLETTRN